MVKTVWLSLALVVLLPVGSAGQGPAFDRSRQQAVLEAAAALVAANYVSEERGQAVANRLRENARRGVYDGLTKPDDFLDAVNRDMQAASNDQHLRLDNNPRIVAQLRADQTGEDNVAPEYVEMLRKEHYRLRRVESREGNIGYFKFDSFVERRFVEDAFVGAMNFLQGSAAVIIDLTDNGGGAADAADLLLAYFLPNGTRTGSTWNRATGRITPDTITTPPGVRPMLGIPVYLLVSERTASAAEAVAYALQQAHRGTVIGSRTKGMANAGELFPIDSRLFVMIPTMSHQDANSGTNWEGVGVQPDIVAPADRASDTAMVAALTTLSAAATAKATQFELAFRAQTYEARVSPETPPPGFVEACLGSYDGNRRVVTHDGALWFASGATERRLTYLRAGTFTVEGRTDFVLHFPLNAGPVKQVEVRWFDDTADTYRRVPPSGE